MEDCECCNGTGISPTGRLDSYCSTCNGEGMISESTEDDFYIPDEPDEAAYDIWAEEACDRYEERFNE